MNKIEDFMHKFSFYFTEQAAGPFLRYGILPRMEHECPFFRYGILPGREHRCPFSDTEFYRERNTGGRLF